MQEDIKKFIALNDALGNTGIKNQQIVKRIIYDTFVIPTVNFGNIVFFVGCQNRDIPFSNLGSGGNILDITESLLIQRFYLTLLNISQVQNAFAEPLSLNIFPGLLGWDLSIEIANKKVFKDYPIMQLSSMFNRQTQFANLQTNIGHEYYEFENPILIPPQVEFKSVITGTSQISTAPPPPFPMYARLTFEGIGTISNLRKTF